MDLFKVIAAIESDSQARAFLNDLCTPKEIDALIERWEVAKLLFKGECYVINFSSG